MFRVAKLGDEKNVSQLVERLFKFEGEGAEDHAKAAADALVEANPQLRDLKTLPAGTFIIVPEVENLSFARGSKPFAAPELAKHIGKAVKGIRLAFDNSLARQTEDANKTLELVKSKEIKAVARKNPEAKKRIGEITGDAKAQLKRVKETEKERTKVFDQMNKQIEDILKSLG